jgi:hypothetical protein
LLALEKFVYSSRGFFRLPYSHDGVHILEDRGYSSLSFHTPGGNWDSAYRLFLVGTEGSVETVAIGTNPWGVKREDAILCVGFIKKKRKHHALQLQLRQHCEARGNGFDVYHDGRMGGRSRKISEVLQAVRDEGRDDLLKEVKREGKTKTMVYLGRLPSYNRMTWRAVRPFLANLLHYSLIRTNLREGHPYKKG